jgi:sigma-54 interacting transcriptional regulator
MARAITSLPVPVSPQINTVASVGATHELSPRRKRNLVKVNCAAIPAGLLESELFGHEKGAFTGALMQKKGRFELADGGTLFLDEIGDIPLELQAKLLCRSRSLKGWEAPIRFVSTCGSSQRRTVTFQP